MVASVRALARKHLDLEKVQENVAYLTKREAQMPYPSYQQQEWPIGSGMVESAHKQVVQTRLKGAGMRWADSNVNPMLALRTVVCNDRWQEAWSERGQYLQQQRRSRRQQRTQQRLLLASTRLLVTLTRLRAFAPPPVAPPAEVPAPVQADATPAGPKPAVRPAATHPWKGRFLPRRRAG